MTEQLQTKTLEIDVRIYPIDGQPVATIFDVDVLAFPHAFRSIDTTREFHVRLSDELTGAEKDRRATLEDRANLVRMLTSEFGRRIEEFLARNDTVDGRPIEGR